MRAFAAMLVLCAAAAHVRAEALPSQRLSLASWNLQWLAELGETEYWDLCRRHEAPADARPPARPPCDAYRRYGIVDAAGYAARKLAPLREAFADMAARAVDVIAVQEVQGAAALQPVLPPAYRIACLTSRGDALNLAFVVREALARDAACREIAELSLEHDPNVARPLRRGLELTVRRGDHEIVMLNVHLKAGCPRGRMDAPGNAACRLLQMQAAPLERWVEEHAGRAFLIVGDWNRDLDEELRGAYPARADGSDAATPGVATAVRNLLAEIDDGDPTRNALALARTDRRAAAGGACHESLDQLVISARLLAALDTASLVGGRLPARLARGPRDASDHCALESELLLK